MIGLTRLQLIAIQCLLLLELPQQAKSDSPLQVVCNETEYLCKNEGRCIAGDKVCNFINDCQDGSDESRCGSCSFENDPTSCGLRFKVDRYYSWYRRDVTEQYIIAGSATSEQPPKHYMSLGLNIQKQHYIAAHGSNWHLIYKPMVLFPELRPTDNKDCQLSIRILVTEHISPIDTRSQRPSWPQINILVMGAKRIYNTNHQSVDLELAKTLAGHHGVWHTFLIPIGAQNTVWTVEIIASVYLESYLLHMSDFKFLDCRPYGSPIDIKPSTLAPVDIKYKPTTVAPVDIKYEPTTVAPVDIKYEPSTVAPIYWAQPCKSNEFKCEITGKCIDESLVCDYGYDCGTQDPSDESDCQQYQARCDFEDDNLCDWVPISGANAWKIISAQEEDQMMYQMHRPLVDHTFRSKRAGHYLLLDSKALRVSEKYSLGGPRVALKEQAKECSFRFWFNVASTLGSDVVKSPYLSVGFERISSEKLFEHLNVTENESEETLAGGFEVSNMGWRRMQVKLLYRYNIDQRVLSVLELAFGNFDRDLQYYLDRGGYLALDDFSFSKGCSISFYGSRQEQYCNEGQFLCVIKTPVTSVRCIPIENYCDFKNDCGLLKSSDHLASDEADCPRECHFHKDQHCSFKPLDARTKQILNELPGGIPVSEAFSWSVNYEDDSQNNLTSPTGLSITSNSAQFIENHLNYLKKPGEALIELDTFEVTLPVFSVSHSNCTFRMEYEWSVGGNNINAYVRLVTDVAGHRNLIKTLGNIKAKQREKIYVGLGNQKDAFYIVISVSHREEVEALKKIKETFIIHNYEFLSCSFFPGLITSDNEVKFINEDSGNDSSGLYGEDYLGDFGLSDIEECAKGYFQCRVPIVCIPQELVCDMQQDCQGGADERNCTGFHQFNFDEAFRTDIISSGWLFGGPEDKKSAPYWWRMARGVSLARRREDSGPPFDHSTSDYIGNYLIAGGETKPAGKQVYSYLHSPHFLLMNASEKLESSQEGCRLVFYLYAWGRDKGTLRILKRTFPSAKAFVIYESKKSIADRWIRIWLELDPTLRADTGDTEFSLVFEFTSGTGQGVADAIAIDDVSFSPACVRSNEYSSASLSTKLVVVSIPLNQNGVMENQQLAAPDELAEGGSTLQVESNQSNNPHRVGILFLLSVSGIGLLGYVSFCGYFKAGLIRDRRQNSARQTMDRQSFIAAEYSLENLDRVKLWHPKD